MNEPSSWDKTVMKAWLMRNNEGPRYHPPKAGKIYRRYMDNIERVEAWHNLTRAQWRRETNPYKA